MSRTEKLIWAAGFFDGEGCVSVSRSKKGKPTITYTIRLTVFQSSFEPLIILHDLFGGSIRPRKASGTSRCGWVWALGGNSLIIALEELMPYLIVKKAQAQLAVIFQGRKAPKGGKYADPVAAKAFDETDYLTMRALKREGV